MKLLLAVDSITTLQILLHEITARSWPDGTEARVVSIVETEKFQLKPGVSTVTELQLSDRR